MKKNILIIGLAGVLGIASGLTSCAPDYETEFKVMTLVIPDKSQAPIAFPLAGGTQDIEVKTNVAFENWQAKSNAEWCKVTKQDKKVIVSAEENVIYKQRKAEITIAYGNQSYAITVMQFGLEPSILVGENMQQEGYMKIIEAEDKTVSVPVATNLEVDNIVIPDTCDWIRVAAQPEWAAKGRANDVVKGDLVFSLDQSTDTVVRYCTIILQSSENYNYVSSFVIKQLKRGYVIAIDEAQKNYQVKASGETIIVPFKVNGPKKAYTYEIEEAAKAWITVPPATRGMRDAQESFVIKPTTVEEVRTGHIIFRSTDPNKPNEFTVTINQDKFIPVPPEGVKNLTAGAGPGFITLKWNMPENINFTTSKISYYDKVAHEEKVIEVTDNSVSSWNVENTFKCAGEYTFTITTYGPTGLATAHPATVVGTSGEAATKARIPLTIEMLSGNANEPKEGSLAALLDGKATTFYHTMWSMTQPEGQPHHLQIDLTTYGLQNNFTIEYNSRGNGDGGGDVKRAGIWGSNDVNVPFKKIGTFTFPLPTTRGGLAASNESIKENNQAYRYIRFIPESRRNLETLPMNGTGFWNMGDLFIYKKNVQDEAWAKKELGIQ